MENAIGEDIVLGLAVSHDGLSESPASVLDDWVHTAEPDEPIQDAWQISFSYPAAPSIRTTIIKPDQMH